MALVLAGGAGGRESELGVGSDAVGEHDVLQVVDDQTGQAVICPNGKPLEIKEEQLNAPPPPSADSIEAAAARGNIIVLERKATCGPNGTLKWVDIWGEEPADTGIDPLGSSLPPSPLPSLPG
jgi:hypothetical protein